MIGNTVNRWIGTRPQLARLSRKNGQGAKARALEAYVSKLLAQADADHPLVRELRVRR